MQVIICENKDQIAIEAFKQVKTLLDEKPNAVLGLATGSSPIGLYKELVKAYKDNEISFKEVKTVNLDEYVGIQSTHSQSYNTFMKEHLFDHVDIKSDNTFLPNGNADDLEKECDRYEKLLENLHVDLQVLGIGSNGHIGFNEPDTSFDSTTHVIDLAKQTLIDNARFFNHVDEVPKQAITMGISSILKAKKIILIASGKSKAKAIKAMIMGPITESVPASILQNHQDVVVIVDKEAASEV